MQWNIDYELASIVYMLAFFCFFVIKKQLPTRQKTAYLVTVVIAFFATVMDVFTAWTNSYPWYVGWQVMVWSNVIYFILVTSIALSFFCYILSVAGHGNFMSNPMFTVFLLPAIITDLLILTTPLTGFVFVVDKDLNYFHGPAYAANMVVGCFYIFLSFGCVMAGGKKVDKKQRVSVYLFCSVIIVGMLFQAFFFQNILISNFLITLALVIFYITIENPDEYIDRVSGIFNADAFTLMCNEYFREGRAFSCVFVTVADYRNLDAIYGTENVNLVREEVIRYMRTVFKPFDLFMLKNLSFVIKENLEGDYEKTVRALKGRFEKPFYVGNMAIVLETQIVAIPYWNMPKNFQSINNIYSFVTLSLQENPLGRNVVVVDDEVIRTMQHERAVEHAIENAITNRSVQVYFQPIYSVEENRITSCEALARLFDDDIGFISPDEFIRKAERNGSILNLGTQIFEKVCIFIKEHRPRQYGLSHIHVNLSPMQFKQETLVEELIDITNRYEVDRSMIVLEITETAAVEGSESIRRNMEKLIAAHFTFSLDDYGTGFSNTATIIQMPFSSVKIDKSVVWSYFQKKSTILPDLITMFMNQGLRLIAEGVETKEMVNALSHMKCSHIQGFYFSKPLPQREFIAYLWDFNRRNEEETAV